MNRKPGQEGVELGDGVRLGDGVGLGVADSVAEDRVPDALPVTVGERLPVGEGLRVVVWRRDSVRVTERVAVALAVAAVVGLEVGVGLRVDVAEAEAVEVWVACGVAVEVREAEREGVSDAETLRVLGGDGLPLELMVGEGVCAMQSLGGSDSSRLSWQNACLTCRSQIWARPGHTAMAANRVAESCLWFG